MALENGSTTASDRVVVGVDGSPASLDTLEWALRYSSMSHSTVEVVAAWDWPVNVSLAPIAPDFAQAMSAEQMLDALIRQKRVEHPGLRSKAESSRDTQPPSWTTHPKVRLCW